MKYLEEISMIIAASIMMLAVNWNPGIAMFLPLITIGRPSLKSVRMALLLVAVFTALILIQPMAGAAGINLPDELFRLVLLMLFIVMVALLIERVEKVRSLRELNRELKRQAERLEDANKELEAFAYSVSHDLRVPLRAIDGFSRILVEDYEDKLDEEGVRLLGIIRDNTKKMGQLIDDILMLSRAGRQDMKLDRLDMKALTESVYRELADQEDRAIEFSVADLPPAYADRALMTQVLSNLLSNAIKFTRERNPARIEVGFYEEDDEYVYYVRDNGAGFDMKYVNKLFGLFQRLHSSDEFEGTGVGLSIVQRIIRRHGGRVWGEGEVDRGATIYFTLPKAVRE
ncbi:ATP-binding protein [Methanothermobacter wolfeii]|uniref:histidine kinase n=2 Tax=Methanothermobacter wolfeii TaxID=145261 RepID=A0ABU8TTQ5_METWO|nr:ATP-binding protein [Methanothermobacter wolfeii]NLM02899.1 two-component sensor histidine kinase [Methanothermobacter wolfeii]SCM57004.1 Cyanobacterial phytochrome B [Methanothermobacter wolfeii]